MYWVVQSVAVQTSPCPYRLQIFFSAPFVSQINHRQNNQRDIQSALEGPLKYLEMGNGDGVFLALGYSTKCADRQAV
jgi:hypothetical protein